MDKKSLGDKIVLAITTVLGVGYTPFCPGTAAGLVALGFFLLIKNPIIFLVFTLVSTGGAFFLSGKAEKIFREKDCKKIVIDDFSGMLVTFLFIPHEIRYVIAGFFLFRMLDLLKIPPASRLEKFAGARGIVGDDLVAGIYSNLTLQLVKLFV